MDRLHASASRNAAADLDPRLHTQSFNNFFSFASRSAPVVPFVYEGRCPARVVGDNMQRFCNSVEETNRWLDGWGAEPLAGSGFEQEQPDPEFSNGQKE